MTLTLTAVDVATIPRIDHDQAMGFADTEFRRVLDLLQRLDFDEWHTPTVCALWDVRDLVAHVVGMAEAQASLWQFVHDLRAAHRRTGGPMIDAMTATQVRERADLSPAQLIDRFARVAPAAVRARRGTPALLRWAVRMKQDPPFHAERWTYGYLVDTIFTRDAWMHRLDISRATGHEMVVTPQHDGHLVADIVAEWARRHGQPFTLSLTGPAGGHWRSGSAGVHIELDALDFCWTLAGRARGVGLLSTVVPF